MNALKSAHLEKTGNPINVIHGDNDATTLRLQADRLILRNKTTQTTSKKYNIKAILIN